jgi:hypothetical protein
LSQELSLTVAVRSWPTEEPLKGIEYGNAGEVTTNGTGWIIGYGPWLAEAVLRHTPEATIRPAEGERLEVTVKWYSHPRGQRDEANKPSNGRTISLLVSERGGFRLTFSNLEKTHFTECVLSRHGDFVVWGEGLNHKWVTEYPSTVLTVRWEPRKKPEPGNKTEAPSGAPHSIS